MFCYPHWCPFPLNFLYTNTLLTESMNSAQSRKHSYRYVFDQSKSVGVMSLQLETPCLYVFSDGSVCNGSYRVLISP